MLNLNFRSCVTRAILLVALLCPGLFWAAVAQQSELPAMKNWFFAAGDWSSEAQLFVRELGTGEQTVVMLHGGWGAEHSGLVDMIRGLESEFKFVFYEQRGSLRSAAPENSITYQQHIDDLEALRKQLGEQKLLLVGHSMGSVLASAYAERFPNNIQKLVLVSPAYLKNPVPEDDQAVKHEAFLRAKAFMSQARLDAELAQYGLQNSEDPLNHKALTAKNRINFAANMLYDITQWPQLTNGMPLYKANVYRLTEQTYPENGWDFWQEFAKQQYPVAIISGSHDRFDFDGLLLKHWQKSVPSVSVRIIDKAGHLPWVDQQQALVDALRTALSE